MSEICVTGWKVGFDKVRMSKFLREEMSISLSVSHAMVEDILDGREIVVPVSPERYRSALSRLELIGVKFHGEA